MIFLSIAKIRKNLIYLEIGNCWIKFIACAKGKIKRSIFVPKTIDIGSIFRILLEISYQV